MFFFIHFITNFSPRSCQNLSCAHFQELYLVFMSSRKQIHRLTKKCRDRVCGQFEPFIVLWSGSGEERWQV